MECKVLSMFDMKCNSYDGVSPCYAFSQEARFPDYSQDTSNQKPISHYFDQNLQSQSFGTLETQPFCSYKNAVPSNEFKKYAKTNQLNSINFNNVYEHSDQSSDLPFYLQQPNAFYDLTCTLDSYSSIYYPSFNQSTSNHASYQSMPVEHSMNLLSVHTPYTKVKEPFDKNSYFFKHENSLSSCFKPTAPKGVISSNQFYDARPRRSANARERGRTLSLNSAFQNLQSAIPTDPPDRKLSKIETIRLATTYIAHLHTLLHAEEDELNMMPCVRMRSSLTRLLKKGRLAGLDVARDGNVLGKLLRGENSYVEDGPTIICTFCLSMSKMKK